MATIASSAYFAAIISERSTLERSGNGLENPFVYDHAAKELKALETHGVVETVEEQFAEHDSDRLIDEIVFRRLRGEWPSDSRR